MTTPSLIGFPSAGYSSEWDSQALTYRSLLTSCDSPRLRKRLTRLQHLVRVGWTEQEINPCDVPVFRALKAQSELDGLDSRNYRVTHTQVAVSAQPSCYYVSPKVDYPVYESKRGAKNFRGGFMDATARLVKEVDKLAVWASYKCFSRTTSETSRQESGLAARAAILEQLTCCYWVDSHERWIDSLRFLDDDKIVKFLRGRAIRAARRSLREWDCTGMVGDTTGKTSLTKCDITTIDLPLDQTMMRNEISPAESEEFLQRHLLCKRIAEARRQRSEELRDGKKEGKVRGSLLSRKLTSLRKSAGVITLMVQGESLEFAAQKLGFRGENRFDLVRRAVKDSGLIDCSQSESFESRIAAGLNAREAKPTCFCD